VLPVDMINEHEGLAAALKRKPTVALQTLYFLDTYRWGVPMVMVYATTREFCARTFRKECLKAKKNSS
jgi:hypothetical protein